MAIVSKDYLNKKFNILILFFSDDKKKYPVFWKVPLDTRLDIRVLMRQHRSI